MKPLPRTAAISFATTIGIGLTSSLVRQISLFEGLVIGLVSGGLAISSFLLVPPRSTILTNNTTRPARPVAPPLEPVSSAPPAATGDHTEPGLPQLDLTTPKPHLLASFRRPGEVDRPQCPACGRFRTRRQSGSDHFTCRACANTWRHEPGQPWPRTIGDPTRVQPQDPTRRSTFEETQP